MIACLVDQFCRRLVSCYFYCTYPSEHGRRRGDRVRSCNPQLHCLSVCDWHVYVSVQSSMRLYWHYTAYTTCHGTVQSSLMIACLVDQFCRRLVSCYLYCTYPSEQGRRRGDRVRWCTLQLHCRSVCDWHVYCSVQPWKITLLTPNLVCVMSPCLSWVAHVGSILSEGGEMLFLLHYPVRAWQEERRQSRVVQATTALPECLWLACLLLSPTLNEAVLTLYFVYYVSWHCTVSVDDCLLGGSILSEVGVSQSFILHHQTVWALQNKKMRQSQVVQSTAALPERLWLARLLVSPILED